MSIELWHLVKDWLLERGYDFKTSAVVDGTPIYQVVGPITPPPRAGVAQLPCVSYLIIKDDEIQITSYRVDITQYNNTIEDLTLTGPVKTIKAAQPDFFVEMEAYLNRLPPPPVGFDPSAPPLRIIDCYFDGTGKTGPMLELVDPYLHVLVTGCVFKDCGILIQAPPPAPTPVLPPNFWVAAPAPVLQLSISPDYKTLQPLQGKDNPISTGGDSKELLPGTPGMRGTPDQAT